MHIAYARCLQNHITPAQKNTGNIKVSNTVRGKNTSTTFLIRHTDFQKQKKTASAKYCEINRKKRNKPLKKIKISIKTTILR